MLKFSVADAKAQFARLLHEAEYDQQRFIMTKKEKGIAAIISMQDLSLLESLADQWFLLHAIDKLGKTDLNTALSLAELEAALVEK